MIYEPIDVISHAEAEQAANNSLSALQRAIVAVTLHDDDFEWAVNFCERFAHHSDSVVRGNSALGFGHLARRFRQMDETRIRPLIEAGLSDPDSYVQGHADSAADDIEFFVGWRASKQ